MNCLIPGLNVKVLAKALQSLAKIGYELFLEAKQDKLKLLTFNQSKTICGQYHLLQSFFSLYTIKDDQLNENSAINCKIHMKTLLPLFKGNHIEKKLEFLRIDYIPSIDTIQFQVKYKTDDILMTHILTLMEPEILSIDDYSSFNNNICADSSFYNDLLNLFSSSDDEITLEITKNKMVARNYNVGAPHKPKSVRSQVNLNGSEFALYRIKEETTVNFSLKPFRTAIAFADTFNLNIGIDFDRGGRPLSINMKNPTFEVVFVLATMNPYTDGRSTVSATSLPTKLTQVHMNGVQNEVTVADLEAIANEKWDEDINTETDHFKNSPDRDKKSSNNRSGLEKKKRLTAANVTSWLDSKKISSKGPKQFQLDEDFSEKDKLGDMEVDYVPRSPESPRTKKARLVFKRSYDQTFNPENCNNVLLGDSDSE